ncbi:uncharacterized protein RCC_09178 [Ramularia collo-cygni]|uniref:Uncharacterized protein n=1 Tax=Ramularia collo-cygni TaxID=112498 RepID=A0A2D3VLM6_9PEZI|nr:uncharacterized protein RCC_09178 [Ramularia collo-cygni]CZT23464.1 uncharacterized protein RCC_09178 [Ramularia collo-cygni]
MSGSNQMPFRNNPQNNQNPPNPPLSLLEKLRRKTESRRLADAAAAQSNDDAVAAKSKADAAAAQSKADAAAAKSNDDAEAAEIQAEADAMVATMAAKIQAHAAATAKSTPPAPIAVKSTPDVEGPAQSRVSAVAITWKHRANNPHKSNAHTGASKSTAPVGAPANLPLPAESKSRIQAYQAAKDQSNHHHNEEIPALHARIQELSNSYIELSQSYRLVIGRLQSLEIEFKKTNSPAGDTDQFQSPMLVSESLAATTSRQQCFGRLQ